MRFSLRMFLSAALLLITGCAGVPFQPTELTATLPSSAAEITNGLWNRGSGRLMLRHSALFEFRGMRVPVTAMMQLDLDAKEARLVGMNDMGVKLYDITVRADSSQTTFIMPELARYPGFADSVAASVRRIFLKPEPAPADRLRVTRKSYLMTRDDEAGNALRFTFGGSQAQLLEKSCRGPADSWRVRYYQYQRQDGRLFPGGIVLDDDRAGYRLTIWIESVEASNE